MLSAFALIPPITRALIVINVLVHLLGLSIGAELLRTFALWQPWTPQFHPWQLVTYSFLHGSWLHLVFNLFAIWMFGAALERRWSDLRYLLTYLLSVVVAAMTQIVVTGYLMQRGGPMIGASGGAFGLMLAYAMYFPANRIRLLIPPIEMSARRFVLVYGVLELALGVTGTANGVAHFAHLGGLFGGWLGVQYFRGRGLFGSRRPPSSH